jgi:hypothetical protein
MSRVVEVIQYGTAATGGRRLKVEVGRVGRQGATGATGATGPAGATGATGAQGPAGQGVPVGGSTGQVLSKVSGTDYDTTWSTVSGGGGAPAAHAASHQDGGSDELALDASQITSGTVATARLGSGTANGARYLAGNQTWALPYSYWLRLAFSDADYTVASSQSVFVMQTGTLSAARVVTLPSTASFAAGQEVILWSGAGVSATNTLTVQGASSQTVNGSGTTFVITQPNRLVRFVSNANTGITATNPNWVVDTFDVDGSEITSGTVPFARLPVGTTSTTVAVGDDTRLSDARTPTSHKVSHQAGGSDELTLSAAQLTSGTVATARLGSGTANSSSYLRGDQTWASPTPWTVITDTTLGTAAATFSVTVTGYSVVEVYLTGRSTDTGLAAYGMRVLFNSDTGTNYLHNNSAAQTVLAPGSIPGSLTNADRTGIWQASISLGGVGKYTSLVYRNAYVTSTGTTGLAASSTSGSGYYINTSSAITSMTLYPSSGNWFSGECDGTHRRVRHMA